MRCARENTLRNATVGHEVVNLLRLYGRHVSEQVTVLLAALENHEGRLYNAFTVIGTTGVRIRRVSY